MEKKSNLLISKYFEEITRKFEKSQILIIIGQPGSGKSTQVPQLIYDLTKSKVIVTQPRRLAAVEMAKRVSEEMNEVVKVNYTVRFENTADTKTNILFVTDGVLLRLLMEDNLFSEYKTIIVDEVHERTIFIDLILFLMKKKLEKNPNSKLILMSATMKLELFKNYFNNYKTECILIDNFSVFQVSIQHMESQTRDTSTVKEAVDCVVSLHTSESAGDILVFLPGSEECLAAISMTQERLLSLISQGRKISSLQMHALFGSQTIKEQEKAFMRVEDDQTTRKVIFATNIAETSLTIENIAFVVDSGLVKRTQFNKESSSVQLKVSLISKSQAIQRAGRAGRTRDGKVIRLYSKRIFEEVMADQTEADIKRSELRSFVVMVLGFGFETVKPEDFIESPDETAIKSAFCQLFVAGIVVPKTALLSCHKNDSKTKEKIETETKELLSEKDILRKRIIQQFRQEKNEEFKDSFEQKEESCVRFELTELGKSTIYFPIDPLFAKLTLLSVIFKIEHIVTKLVAFQSSTENLMNNSLEAKKEFYKMKIKDADRDGDFYTLLNLIQNHSHLFHKKALKNIELIQNQIKQICSKFSFDKISQMMRDDLSINYSKKELSTKEKISLILQSCFATQICKRISNKNDYKLICSEVSCLLDSESVFEMIDYYPEFVIATGIRGVGHLGIPNLLNVFRLKNCQIGFELSSKITKFEEVENHQEEAKNEVKEKPFESNSKIEQARLKFEQRKKIKTENGSFKQ